MAEKKFYTPGGTVQSAGGIYLPRQADSELLDLCLKSEFAFVLASRQVGKSSLMVNTIENLGKKNIRTASVDLSLLRKQPKEDEWYFDIVGLIAHELRLRVNIKSWWENLAGHSPTYKFMNFFQEVVLKKIKTQVVIFFDEIDTTLENRFSDDFFVAIRSFYNLRATHLIFKRLTFVLVGTAAPNDLIKDVQRTPFNIGTRVELTDFTFEELVPLASGLGKTKKKSLLILSWIYEWTNGHPYLTQMLRSILLENQDGEISKQEVDNTVFNFFINQSSKTETHFKFIRDFFLRRAKNPRKVIEIYNEILSGETVQDSEQDIYKSHLKLTGLARSRHKQLMVTNKIYEVKYDKKWIAQQLSVLSETTTAIASFVAVLGIILIITLIYRNFAIGLALIWFLISLFDRNERNKFFQRFRNLIFDPRKVDNYSDRILWLTEKYFNNILLTKQLDIVRQRLRKSFFVLASSWRKLLVWFLLEIALLIFLMADLITIKNISDTLGIPFALSLPNFFYDYRLTIWSGTILSTITSIFLLLEVNAKLKFTELGSKTYDGIRVWIKIGGWSSLISSIISLIGIGLLWLSENNLIGISLKPLVETFGFFSSNVLVRVNVYILTTLIFAEAIKGIQTNFVMLIGILVLLIEFVYALNYYFILIMKLLIDIIYRFFLLTLYSISFVVLSPFDKILSTPRNFTEFLRRRFNA